MDARLEIFTLGGVRILRGGEPVTGLTTRKAEAMLIYLASTRRPQPRELLADLLWDERTQSQAMGNLRGVLSNLHQALGEYLSITREQVELNLASQVWLDAVELEERLGEVRQQGGMNANTAAHACEALALYRGNFLEGFTVIDCRRFEEWAVRERERLHRLAVDSLSGLVAYSTGLREYQAGMVHAARLLELDALMESAHRQMMLLLAASGQRAAALNQYETCQKLLQKELRVEPAAETRDLYKQIRAGNLSAEGEHKVPSPSETVPVKEARLPRQVGACPYRGLSPFQEADAPFYFGRETFIDALEQTVRSQKLVAVIVGSSGSGKSSVLLAGLLPRLRRQAGYQFAIFRPASQPFYALAGALLPLLEPDLSKTDLLLETRKLAEGLGKREVSLAQVIERIRADSSSKKPVLLVVDQFEELYTLCPDAELQKAFIDELLDTVTASRGRQGGLAVILLTLRADFMGQALAYRPFADAMQEASLLMGPMTRAELHMAIEKPAEMQGAAFEAGLVERILDDVGEKPGNLPLLEFTLTQLWERQTDGWLTHSDYEAMGCVEGALATYADQVYNGLEGKEQELARRALVQLVQPGEGTEDTRRLAARAELGDVGWSLIQRLADRRLVVTGRDAAGRETAEVVHEALIQKWGRFQEWMNADRAFRAWQEHLRSNLRQWQASEQDEGALLRGAPLVEAEGFLDQHRDELNAEEVEFILSGVALRERENAEREVQRQRELEAAQKLAVTEKGRAEAESQRAESERQRAEEQGKSAQRLRRRAWLLAGVVAVALLLAMAAVLFGRQASQNAVLADQNMSTAQAASTQAVNSANTRATAELNAVREANVAATSEVKAVGEAHTRATAEAQADENARLATSRYLTSAALTNLKLNPQLSAHLALQAYQTYPTYEAESALRTVLPELRLLSSTPITNSNFINETSMWMGRDGKLIIVATDNGIELTDRTTGIHSVLAPPEPGFICSQVMPSRDGQWLIAVCTPPDIQRIETYVYDVDAKKYLFTFPNPQNQLSCGLIPPSSSHPLLAYAGYFDKTIHVYEVATGKELLVDRTHSATMVDAMPSLDGRRLATYDERGQVTLWDMEIDQQLVQFNAQVSSSGIIYEDLNQDGTRLAILGADPVIKVWDLTSLSSGPRLEHELRSDVGLRTVLYSPDGTRLAAGSGDGLVRVWNTQTGELEITLSGGAGYSALYSFSQDGTRLYTGSNDKTIKEWDLSPSREPLALPGWIGSAPFSPDGKHLVLTGVDGSLSIVDSRTGKVLRKWQAHSHTIDDAVWSPDGQQLATSLGNPLSINNKNAKIWEATTGNLLKEIPGDPYGGFTRVAWSPDSSRLVASSTYSSTVYIWDSATGNLLQTLPKQDTIWALAYSSDGRKIAVNSFSKLVVWDAVTGREVFTHTIEVPPAFGLVFSPDGQRLALGLSNGKIILFQWTKDGVVQEPGFTSGDQRVYALAFSPDGTLLASGDIKGVVRIWDLKTGQKRMEMATSTDAVFRVAFSPDSRRLVASSGLIFSSPSGTTYFYVLPVDELIDLVRSRIVLPMKPEDCRQYLHTETCPTGP